MYKTGTCQTTVVFSVILYNQEIIAKWITGHINIEISK